MFSTPGYDHWYFAWFGFVPLLIAVNDRTPGQKYILFNITGLIWSIGCHSWFPDILGRGLGIFLMVASGFLYAFFLQLGYDLQEKWRHPRLKLLVLPIVWTALEWLRFVLPVTKEWWIEVLAKSQWTVPVHLQILSVTGFMGLSFLIMLVNVSLAAIVLKGWTERKWDKAALAVLVIPLVVGIWSYAVVAGADRSDSVQVAAVTDMVNQDQEITKFGGQATAGDGYVADTEEMSQAIFDVNTALTMEAAKANPSFVVWGENEFADYDNETMMLQLKELAVAANAYIAADMVWRPEGQMHDTVVLIGPNGEEVGKTAKINITSGEKEYGFTPGKVKGNVFKTEFGRVGLAICWDRHTTDIVRAMAKNDAELVLIPVDDDFNGNTRFLPFGASDSVFRAAENRIPIVTGTVSGMSQIITPYGEVVAASPVNERSLVTGATFSVEGRSLYTLWGDWFGAAMACFFALIVIMNFISNRRGRKEFRK